MIFANPVSAGAHEFAVGCSSMPFGLFDTE